MNQIEGKTILFTGGTSGLGKEAVLQLAANGANIIAFVRDNEKGQKLVDEFKTQYPNSHGKIELLECDLASLKSVKLACYKVAERYRKLDVIVNNAGTWNFEFNETIDGIENTLQVNLLAPFLIVNLLFELLKSAADPKVITTASALHQGTIQFSDIEFRKKFNGFKAYRQSKLGVILLTRLYHQKHRSFGIHFYSQHPGLVDTELVRKGGRISKLFFKIFGKTPQKGAENLLYLLKTPTSYLKDGEYYKNCKASKTDTKESYDMEIGQGLYEVFMDYLKKHSKQV
jgi:NAD(P)-dependent dehydrogenase (short-subunit alcohol dehydrogenase family)